MMQGIVNGLNWALVAFSGLAALFWLLAATATVKPKEPDTGEFRIVIKDEAAGGSFSAGGIDVLATAQVQTKWNRWAASFACAAALCQAVVQFIPKAP